jgi:hypothetical protein
MILGTSTRKSVQKFRTWLKSVNNIRHFTWRTKYTCIVDRNYFIARQQSKGKPMLLPMATMMSFMLLIAACK